MTKRQMPRTPRQSATVKFDRWINTYRNLRVWTDDGRVWYAVYRKPLINKGGKP